MAEQKQQLSEQRATGASFIINFYGTVANIKDRLAQYQNVLTELKSKYAGVDLGKIDEADRAVMLQSAQNLRYFMLMAYYDYVSLFSFMDASNKFAEAIKQDKVRIDEILAKVKVDLFPEVAMAEEYLIKLNNFLLQQVVQTLMETSQDILGKIYGQ